MRVWKEQFGRPRGVLGWLAGKLMGRGKEAFARELLGAVGVEPDDRVLEIGFGPGIGIEVAVGLAPRGRVAGVDLSEVMMRMATRRNREAVREGRVELALASVSALPYSDDAFDVAFAINSVQFWPAPATDLKEVRRVLRQGGRLAIGVQLPGWILPATEAEAMGREVERRVREAGFRDVVRVQRESRRISTMRVTATK